MTIFMVNTYQPLAMNLRLILAYSRETECAICLEVIDHASKKITRCHHVFHGACLSQVLSNTCPLCRQVLTVEETFSTSLTQAFQEGAQRPQSDTDRFLDQIGLGANFSVPISPPIDWAEFQLNSRTITHNLNYIS